MILGLTTEIDSVLSVVAPLGLAAAAANDPVVMVDLDETGPSYPGERTLADLVGEGPRRRELQPEGRGVAVIGNGGVSGDDALSTIELLAGVWPAVVLRVPPGVRLPWPVIPVVPLFPGLLAAEGGRAAVWQATSQLDRPPGPGPLLPPLNRATLTSLLSLRAAPGGRWVRAWRQVWELPWG
ncbi:MAG TPA: hypothetical protein VJR05_13175 [Acidimicrobiia bacterium]|nr:hypothetical protein [Acidimicrobiia bacterium]